MDQKKKRWKMLRKAVQYALPVLLLCLGTGCGTSEGQREPVEFTVLAEEEIPDTLKQMIDEQKEAPFQLSYQDGSAWYLAVGYGRQDSSGYSIQVPDFYRTENGLVLDTELLGPETEPTGNGRAPSTPYIVVLTEYRDEPVTYE